MNTIMRRAPWLAIASPILLALSGAGALVTVAMAYSYGSQGRVDLADNPTPLSPGEAANVAVTSDIAFALFGLAVFTLIAAGVLVAYSLLARSLPRPARRL